MGWITKRRSMNIKYTDIESILDALYEKGLTRENIKNALLFCWDRAACLTLMGPDIAYDEVGSNGRDRFARITLEEAVINPIERRRKLQIDEEDKEKFLELAISQEKYRPLFALRAGQTDYISGRRSKN